MKKTIHLYQFLQKQLHQLEFVYWLQKKYPSVYQFLRKRLALKYFTGLPLTILVIILLLNSLLFSEIAENIVNSEPMIRIDQQLTLFLFQRRNSTISILLLGTTQLASQWISIGMVVAISTRFIWQRRYSIVLAWLTVMIGMGACVYWGKLFFQRVRPLHVAYHPISTFSFPSGHSATAMALYGFLAYLIIRKINRFTFQLLIISLSIGIILLIGFSRIYLGFHFLSDVLGGYLVGLSWMIAGIIWVELSRKNI
ncbi:phosphatase PAP2 family protein [Xanthocytophaga flava]|uniref:phosphatase PAP2 family protein n=1 Tax=Xanthocytophaga flava TaxID=3048013 RepID=UPI0028D66442|nr:phosphatase PAP2 family protein [Xanthocytophaga flavus]MDJ1470311.1 phosphatase PAP2 family protein [Xanthocytophaga flavus]